MSRTGPEAYRWSRVGGHPALDLCNTRAWRLEASRSTNRLATPADLTDWYDSVFAGSEDRWTPVADTAALGQVCELRDALLEVLDAHVTGVPAPAPAWDTTAAAWRAALAASTPAEQLPWVWHVDPHAPDAPLHRLGLLAADLLSRADLDRLRRCDGPGCGWLFLDQTRNRSRRWCDPDDCGNRARVRAHTERHRSTT